MAEEASFAKRYLDSLASHSVTYDDDHVTPPEKRPRRMPLVGIDLGDMPMSTKEPPEAGPSSDTINITVKSLKPPLTFSISTSPTDSVSQLKSLVSSSTESAPPASAQRLLVKGKALADHKLLQEYGLTDGATVHLVLKAGWEKEVASTAAEEAPLRASSPGVPALTISVIDDDRPSTPSERPITAADISVPPLGPQPQITSEHYHTVLADPEFWVKIYDLCKSSFTSVDDADGCWQTFLEGHMAHLSAGEIAKIKDVVGVTGMGGKSV